MFNLTKKYAEANQKKVVKVCHLGETKRLKMTQDYLDLVAQTQKVFNMSKEPAFKFYYLDEENELISINSQADFGEALSIEDLASLKLTIAQSIPEARALLMGQISETNTFRDNLNQSGFMPSQSLAALSCASSVIQMPEQPEALATERVRSIMKSIDSDFEDLEDEKSEVAVAEEPWSTQATEVKVVEKEPEVVAKPVAEAVESSDEECIVKGDVPCWKCNGSQKNKRGRPCKKCDGTGLIQSQALLSFIPMIQKEVRAMVQQSFPSLLQDHMLARSEAQATIKHTKFACDGCSAAPIIGIRYKCSVCHDYDLCDKCEEKGVHKEHPMLKIRKPDQAPHSIVCQYQNGINDLMAECQEKMTSVIDIIGQQFRENLDQPIPQAQPKAKPQEAKKFVKYSARFVKESFGDRHSLDAGVNFQKKWTMRNDGKTEWPVDTVLIQTNGDELKFKTTSVGAVRAGEDFVVTADLVAPAQSGRYTTYFRMMTADNYRFGHKIWADIMVEEPVMVVPEAPKLIEADQYPSLDLNEEDLVDKICKSAFDDDDEPEVKIEAPSTTDAHVSSLGKSIGISQIITPKFAYNEKVMKVVDPDVRTNLRELFDMGFTSFEVNSGMLAKYNNDLGTVSELLCDQVLTESCINAIYNK